jgi:hypothetical protein
VNANPIVPPDVAAGRFRPASPRLAVSLGLLYLGLLLSAAPLSALAHQLTVGAIAPLLVFAPFAGVGLVVAALLPRNPIGWIMLALALVFTIGVDAGFYAVASYRVGHDLPLARLAVLLASSWVIWIVLLPLPILLFPDGRLPSRHWRWTAWAYVALSTLFVAAVGTADIGVFTDRRIKVDSSGELARLAGSSNSTASTVEGILALVYALLTLSWVVRQLISYRRSTGEHRQQLKWLMSGGAVCIVGFVISVVFSKNVVGQIAPVAIVALPVGLGVGILKYRLYEIDRLISRTLSYAILTGMLAGVFVGIVALATDVLPFSSPVGVAASTLASAALFNPLRRRVQHLVDRRFNRARYDAEATVAAFTLRLRDAVDLDTVRSELLYAVDRAVEPAHASLWIRSSSSRTGSYVR